MSSSWFNFSLPNSFNSDDENSPPHSPTATATATGKPDFSIITQTIGRQLHNVASFLAPPPQPSSSTPPLQSGDSGDVSPSSSASSYKGIKNDLVEIGGSFKNLLSSNRAVSEISKFASNLLQFDDLEDGQAVGITDYVIDFVREISVRPECWIDFPLSLQHKDFNLSHIQKNHASAIEQLVPSLTALRHKIHSYMSEEQFWVIYFILLLPRLNEDDYRLLSSPEIIQVREVLLQKLRNKKNTPTEPSVSPGEPGTTSSSEKCSQVNSTDRTENPFQAIEPSVETTNATNRIKTGSSNSSPEHHKDDVSFSDLEDEDSDRSIRLLGTRHKQSGNLSSASETGDWVRLNETKGTQGSEQKASRSSYRERRSESGESSDWLAVEDVDL